MLNAYIMMYLLHRPVPARLLATAAPRLALTKNTGNVPVNLKVAS